MKGSGTILAFLSGMSLASSIPVTPSPQLATRDDDRGSYTIDGLGSRKQEVTGAGADTLDLAVAMLETEDMSTDYAYGDNKVDDSANFGIFKQNWGMLRECCSTFSGQATADWNNGATLNDDLNADVSCLNECQQYYGQDTWFGGHRDGSSGLENPSLQVVQDYINGVEWIQQQIEGDATGLTDDTRYWVDVTAI